MFQDKLKTRNSEVCTFSFVCLHLCIEFIFSSLLTKRLRVVSSITRIHRGRRRKLRQLGGKGEEKSKVERITSIVAVCILQRDAATMHLTVSERWTMDVPWFLPLISFVLCFLFWQLYRRSLIQHEFNRLREPSNPPKIDSACFSYFRLATAPWYETLPKDSRPGSCSKKFKFLFSEN